MTYGSDMSFPYYPALDGSALEGVAYFGVAGQNPVTNPVTVFWDSAGTQPAAQPVTISKGRTVRSDGTPSRVWVASDYSVLVQDTLGRQVVFEPNQPVTIAALNAINQATAQVALATAQAAAASTSATSAAGSANTATGARDAALAAGKIFPSTTAALSNGVLSYASLVAGSGGTNGTFDIAFSGGAGTGAAGRFVVAGGALTSITITAPGNGYTSAPAMSFAASSGLSGASATAVIGVNAPVGAYFYVPSTLSSESLILYLNVAGSASEQKRYVSSTVFSSKTPDGYVWAIVDGVGNAAVGLQSDGTFAAQNLTATTATITSLTATSAVMGKETLTGVGHPNYAWSQLDSVGNVAVGLTYSGVLEVASLKAQSLASPINSPDRFGGHFSAQLNLIVNTGQSLAEGSDSAQTNAQEYDNIGFAAAAPSPTVTYPLTVANTQSLNRTGESPMYGCCGFIKESIQKENGLTWQLNDYQLLAVNDALSGNTIEQLSKGGSSGRYEIAIGQVTAAKVIADAAVRSFAFQAVLWTQGEANSANTVAYYKGLLKTLAANYTTDGKAITGQLQDVQFIMYQGSYGANTVAEAMLQASQEVAYIHLASPIYFMDFADGVHIKGTSEKWLGGYYGLCYKRVVVDGKDWQPLKPVSHSVLGNTIDLYFNKEGLVFDTTIMPAQANQGFTLADGGGGAQTISSVAIIGPNRVRITCASTPAAGWSVMYGQNAVTGKTNYSAGGGNLRDSQGDTTPYVAIGQPLHNWCVLFSRTI